MATGGALPSRGPSFRASRDAGVPPGLGSVALPHARQSPVEIALLWDARTLASFSVSQLDAFNRIAQGRCPLLSRTIQCIRHGGKRRRKLSRSTGAGFRDLVAAYMAEEAEFGRQRSVAMMRHVWTNYKARAWGADLLKPVSGEGVNSWGGLGQTLVDALDTLWLMGFRDDFELAANWVEESLSFDQDENVNLFETSIRQLGGLIAAYGLSQRPGLLAKAEDLAGRLIVAYGHRKAVPAAQATEDEKEDVAGVVAKMLKRLGFSQPSAGADGAQIHVELQQQIAQVLLPYSDVHLQSGQVQNLAQFVSLAEAYVPVEWKALALFTGNCSYAEVPDEVLRIVNESSELEARGLAPIMLKPDGGAFPSGENRISLGSRGDSFYEYLLKDTVFTGTAADSTTARTLWKSFRANLPSLYVEADPEVARATATAAAEGASVVAGAAVTTARHSGVGRGRRRKRRKAAGFARASELAAVPLEAWRAGAGARNGWFESEHDATSPWLFLKEVGFLQTIPKIDHLVCFLPGALALDVLHHHGGADAQPGGANLSEMAEDRVSELLIAHRLAQTCVHMYFRTASDLAPEITRFNADGLIDDLGSMHNILRPETVESLFLLWRTTKSQIYRNWGQRILAAFSRLKTPYGYASLHNVNEPGKKKDEMPSFFLAETLKYLFLLFADDSALSLNDNVLTTEAHPIPTIAGWRGRDRWACDVRGKARREATGRRPAEVFSEGGVWRQQGAGAARATDAAGARAPFSEGLRECSGELQAARMETQRCREKLEGTSGTVAELRGNLTACEASRPSPSTPAEAYAALRVHGAEAAAASVQVERSAVQGDQACWVGGFTAEVCCWPAPIGNPLCWDSEFTRQRCCADA